jgi:hypothetical protein
MLKQPQHESRARQSFPPPHGPAMRQTRHLFLTSSYTFHIFLQTQSIESFLKRFGPRT